MQFVDLTEVTIPPAVIELVPESVARENVVLPLSQDNGVLKIIMSDPTDFDTIQKLQFILNKDIQPVLAAARADHRGDQPALRPDAKPSRSTRCCRSSPTPPSTSPRPKRPPTAAERRQRRPGRQAGNLIIQEAVSLRASDIHIEPFADRVRIRYRIDGVLVERDSPPRRLLAPMLSRIKIMGSIDIAEKRRPQDGRIKMNLHGKHFDLRVSMLPTVHGQSARHAHPRPRQHPGDHQGPRLRRGRLQALPADHQAAQRHLPGDRADRLGQDDHAVFGTEVPLRADLGKNRSSSLTVTNTEEAKTFEVRAVSWKQQNRTDSYAPTDDLLLAPATFRLEKGASQVVRIQLNRPLDAAEHAYRVFIDEVPVAKEIKPNTLKTVVSMAVPVFVAPASGPIAKGQAALKASLAKDVINIELSNTGKANLKLREWVLTSAKAGELLKVPSAAYVLSGNTLTGDYPLRIQADGPLQLRAITDRGSFSTDVTR